MCEGFVRRRELPEVLAAKHVSAAIQNSKHRVDDRIQAELLRAVEKDLVVVVGLDDRNVLRLEV